MKLNASVILVNLDLTAERFTTKTLCLGIGYKWENVLFESL
jgi:hypothetical protein